MRKNLHNMMRGYRGGGVITDPRGQWAHPGEITKIPSNNITMKGVPYPVLGVSDKGHTQMMQPGGEYKFKGKSVTEYPQKYQNGGGAGEKPIPKPKLPVKDYTAEILKTHEERLKTDSVYKGKANEISDYYDNLNYLGKDYADNVRRTRESYLHLPLSH